MLLEVKLKTSSHARNDVFSCVVLSKMLLPAIVLILTHGTHGYSCSTATICWKSNIVLCQWASIHFEHSRNELALAEFTILCSWTRHLTLTMPHSSNNITFGGLGGTHTCKNKTLVFNCEDHFHFHRFCLSYFFKRFFLVRYRRNLAILLKITATCRSFSTEVTANSNTLHVFQYKTNNYEDGRSYTCVYNHSHAPQSFTNIAGS